VEEKIVKKIMIIICFNLVAITMTTTAQAITFTSQEAIYAHAERERQLALEVDGNFEKGKTDDAALKEAIISLPKLMVPNLDMFGSMAKNMTQRGIPRERQIQAQEEIIREFLPTVGKNETSENVITVCLLLQTLNTYPDYDIFPILQECMDSHNEFISTWATRLYNKIKGNAQDQPTPANDERSEDNTGNPSEAKTPTQPAITDTPQPETLPPAIADEAEQPIQDTPPEQPEKTSPNKTILWLAVLALLAILGGVVAWKRKP
jgi:hypothetical protein